MKNLEADLIVDVLNRRGKVLCSGNMRVMVSNISGLGAYSTVRSVDDFKLTTFGNAMRIRFRWADSKLRFPLIDVDLPEYTYNRGDMVTVSYDRGKDVIEMDYS